MRTFNYKTIEGGTWSSVAWKMYGSMSGISTLIQANPGVPIEPVFNAGTILYIPILEDNSEVITSTNTPPWK